MVRAPERHTCQLGGLRGSLASGVRVILVCVISSCEAKCRPGHDLGHKNPIYAREQCLSRRSIFCRLAAWSAGPSARRATTWARKMSQVANLHFGTGDVAAFVARFPAAFVSAYCCLQPRKGRQIVAQGANP